MPREGASLALSGAQNASAGARFLLDAASLHDDDVIAERHSLGLVVGHEDADSAASAHHTSDPAPGAPAPPEPRPTSEGNDLLLRIPSGGTLGLGP